MALEGKKSNILVNAVVPVTKGQLLRPGTSIGTAQPEYVSALVLLLASEHVPDPSTGLVIHAGSGWQAQRRWQRAGGHIFPLDTDTTPEAVLAQWPKITNFDDDRVDYPKTISEASAKIFQNLMELEEAKKNKKTSSKADGKDYVAIINRAKTEDPLPLPFSWTWRDTILYNLGLGARRTQLPFVFEKDPNFQVLPVYGVIPMYGTPSKTPMNELVPNFAPTSILHGEQYLEIHKFPIPTAAKVASYATLLEVIDKGNAAITKHEFVTKDTETGEVLFTNISALWLRGCGGFGGVKQDINRGPSSVDYKPPNRAPDAVTEEKTSEDLAALYRLNGDHLPLHIDPVFAKKGGFDTPILHGLCTMGFAGKHVLLNYGEFKNIKVRFAGIVLPGQTLVTEMWKDGDRVTFQTKVKETGKFALTSCGAQLRGSPKQNL